MNLLKYLTAILVVLITEYQESCHSVNNKAISKNASPRIHHVGFVIFIKVKRKGSEMKPRRNSTLEIMAAEHQIP